VHSWFVLVDTYLIIYIKINVFKDHILYSFNSHSAVRGLAWASIYKHEAIGRVSVEQIQYTNTKLVSFKAFIKGHPIF